MPQGEGRGPDPGRGHIRVCDRSQRRCQCLGWRALHRSGITLYGDRESLLTLQLLVGLTGLSPPLWALRELQGSSPYLPCSYGQKGSSILLDRDVDLFPLLTGQVSPLRATLRCTPEPQMKSRPPPHAQEQAASPLQSCRCWSVATKPPAARCPVSAH
ncbi:hypothetical protein NDU88_001936 [Pleurodeles waltl]|uniref:Uncharacterized protein n=1 Tax=Pleurodeles waltl TaxID=8319 RepID=A0AAV7M1W7_PLEWA|nr:hypothetical protein NDU88_001936 [Pleurodeles waltl]